MTAYRLDHLAIAVPRWEGTGRYLTDHWGARWKHGFTGVPQFHPAQLSLRDGRRVELLEPDGDEQSFIQRFLEGGGMRPRVHHVTFYVPDIEESIEGIRRAGLTPQQIRIDNEIWREAFVYPKDSGVGFLVQVVQSAGDPAVDSDGGVSPFLCSPPAWSMLEGGDEPAAFECIIGQVGDLADATRLLVDVLGADETSVAGSARETRAYTWEQGPSIVLECVPAEKPGITAIAVSRAGADTPFGHATVDAARVAPHIEELGMRLVEL